MYPIRSFPIAKGAAGVQRLVGWITVVLGQDDWKSSYYCENLTLGKMGNYTW